MGCSSCASKSDGLPKGCKSNGNCGVDSCNKLTVFDWLSDVELPAGSEPFDAVEVRFKNGRKEFLEIQINSHYQSAISSLQKHHQVTILALSRLQENL